MPMEYILPSLRIARITGMDDIDTVDERLAQPLALEEDRFIAGFHQKVQRNEKKLGTTDTLRVRLFRSET